MIDDSTYAKYVLKGMLLTILSAAFAVVGLVTAVRTSVLAGVLIVISSLAFWGYTCVLSDNVERQRIARGAAE